jgi:hypothetical protein
MLTFGAAWQLKVNAFKAETKILGHLSLTPN